MNERKRRAPFYRPPQAQAMDVRYEDLSRYGQISVARTKLSVHWRGEGEQTVCGMWLTYSIWADEDAGAVTCRPCLREMETQEALPL